MLRYILHGALASLVIAQDTSVNVERKAAKKIPRQHTEHTKFKEAFDPWKHHATFKPHEIVTDDGYIITVFQLINRPAENRTIEPTKASVLLMNGTFQDAAGWFWVEENELTGHWLPFPIRLLHEHYDVWLGNYRGSTYS